MNQIISLFKTPKVIGLIGDTDTGKTNLINHFIHTLREFNTVRIFQYGLKNDFKGVVRIHSIEELEQIRNSVVFLDELFTLFDLDNKKAKGAIENTLRLIFHNNNVLVLCALPENMKKFISGKLHVMIFKRISIADLINGSRVKNAIMSYRGEERGQAVLNLADDEAIIYDLLHYKKIKVPYLKEYDTKAQNVPILVPKMVHEKEQKEVEV